MTNKIKIDCEDIATLIGVLESRLEMMKENDDYLFEEGNKRCKKVLNKLKSLGLIIYLKEDIVK